MEKDNNNLVRFLLTFFLGWIGSLIINHTSLKPAGWKSKTLGYFFLDWIFGIHRLIASICNFTFDPNKASNIGYFKDGTPLEVAAPVEKAETEAAADTETDI